MVSSVWRHSTVRRAVMFLLTCARGSILARFWPALIRQYSLSRFRVVCERVLGARQTGALSFCSRLAVRVNALWQRLGAALYPAWEHGLPLRAKHALRGAGWLRGSLIGRLALGLRRGELLLLVFVLYLPIDYVLRDVLALTTLSAYWDELYLLLCFACLLLWKLSPRADILPVTTPLDAPMLLFMALGVLLVGVVSPILGVAIDGYRAVFQYMLWFFVLVRLLRTKHAVRLLYVSFILLGAALALHGLYQYVVGTPIPRSWVSVSEMGVRTRVFSILGSPNIMGCIMVMLAPLAAGMAYAVRNTRHALLCWAAAGAMCLACVFSFSRGAWLGLAVAVLLFALLRDRRLLILAGLAGAVALMSPQITNRISYLFTSDFAERNEAAGRSARWASGMDLLMRNDPVFGFGLGRFGGAVAMQNQTQERLKYFYMDNYYLKTLVEMGYVGLGGYLFLLAAALWNGLRALFRTRQHSEEFSLACGLMASMAGVLTHCYFENIFEVPYMNAYFWGLCAMLMVIGFRLTLDTKRTPAE